MHIPRTYPSLTIQKRLLLTFILILSIGCKTEKKQDIVSPTPAETNENKIKVIFDTDANNELDDQHALAYLLFNGNSFQMDLVTVNATFNGGDIQGHYDEALRVLQLCNAENKVRLIKGANLGFSKITKDWNPEDFDGKEAVDAILNSTRKEDVIVVAVGKLTNIALALKKEPDFAKRTRVVWLGSNYPEPGEYNQINDTVALNYVLKSEIPFEMVTVRYGDPSGTDAVKVTQEEINARMPGLGLKSSKDVTGRHGGTFSNFGDYSVSLFKYIDYHGDPPSRSLFDMVVLAILKNPSWGNVKEVPAPLLIDGIWVERLENARKIKVWENFSNKDILEDFYSSMNHPVLIN